MKHRQAPDELRFDFSKEALDHLRKQKPSGLAQKIVENLNANVLNEQREHDSKLSKEKGKRPPRP